MKVKFYVDLFVKSLFLKRPIKFLRFESPASSLMRNLVGSRGNLDQNKNTHDDNSEFNNKLKCPKLQVS